MESESLMILKYNIQVKSFNLSTKIHIFLTQCVVNNTACQAKRN
jgi:hypothetical protein